MSEHTPGPWRRSAGIPQRIWGFYLEAPSGESVNQTAEANARLIAAAPDLLEALRRIADGQWPQSIAETEGTLAMREVAKVAIERMKGDEHDTH